MLKHLYKTFIISIISGSLLTIQPSVVFAAAATTTTDSKGTITSTETKKFEKIKDEDLMASITMLGGGFIAARMYNNYTPATMDVMIAGAAGVAFIAGEIMTNLKFKGTIEEMTVEVVKKSDGTVNEEQIKRLEDLKKSYEEAKKTTKTKKTLQLAAAAGFGIAAATAIYLSFTEEGMVGSCRLAVQGARTSLTACAASSATGNVTEATACKACAGGLTRWEGIYNTYYTMRKPPGNSNFKDSTLEPWEKKVQVPIVECATGATAQAVAKGIASVCTPSIRQMVKNQTEQLTGLGADVNQSIQKILNLPVYTAVPVMQSKEINYFEKGLDLFFPKAQASWIPMLGLTAGVAAAFFAVTGAVAVEIDMLMFVPTNRAIAFGLLATTSFLAAKSSGRVIEKLDENIAKIEKILSDLNRNAKGIKAQNLTQQQIKMQTIDSQSNEALEFSKNGTVKTPCMTGNSTENCASVTDTLKNMPGFANLPDSFKDLATQTTNLGDKLGGASGISGSTLSSADSLGAKQNAISKLLKARQETLLKKTGIDLDKEQGKLQNRLTASARKALSKHGMNSAGMMASLGGTAISTSAKDDSSSAPFKSATPTQNVVDIGAKGEVDPKDKDKGLDFNFKDGSAETAAVDMSGGTTAAPEYQIDSNEINGKNGPSLFEVLSNRYIKSGYPKLLEEEPTTK